MGGLTPAENDAIERLIRGSIATNALPLASGSSTVRWQHHGPDATGRPRCAHRLLAATAQAQAEATKSAQRAGIDHKRRVEPTAYLGRKPSYTRQQLDRIVSALSSPSAPSLSTIARTENLTKQTVHRIKSDPQAASAALGAWGL